MVKKNRRPCVLSRGVSISAAVLLMFLCLVGRAPAQDRGGLEAMTYGTRPVDFDDMQEPTDEAAVLLDPLEVSYPDSAMKRGWEGVAVVAAWIDRSGYPVYAEVQESSGHGDLDGLALQAVIKGNFKAARRNGRNVGARVTIPVEFRLRREHESYDAVKSEQQLQKEADELRRAREMLEEEQQRLEEEIRLLKEQQKKKRGEDASQK